MKTVYQTIGLIILFLLIACADSFANDRIPRKRLIADETYTYTCSSGNAFRIITKNPAIASILQTYFAPSIKRVKVRNGATNIYFTMASRRYVECYIKNL